MPDFLTDEISEPVTQEDLFYILVDGILWSWVAGPPTVHYRAYEPTVHYEAGAPTTHYKAGLMVRTP